MKIGKEEIFAIVECGLFLIGAGFFAAVLIDSSNPIWALWVGIVFAVAGVLLWLHPVWENMVKNLLTKIAQAKAAAAAKATATNTQPDEPHEDYELHRQTSYDAPQHTNATKATKSKKNATAQSPIDVDLDF